MNERKQSQIENEKAIAAYFKQGGKVTTCEPGARSDPEQLTSQWHRKKPGEKAK